jgi:hypothetical protein
MTMTKRSTLLLAVALLVGFSGLRAQNATPKNMFEIGVNAGHFFISGDIPYSPGYGAGLHVRKSLDYVFSLRGDAFYGLATGTQGAPETNNFREFETPIWPALFLV